MDFDFFSQKFFFLEIPVRIFFFDFFQDFLVFFLFSRKNHFPKKKSEIFFSHKMHKNQEKKKTIIRLRLSPVFRELHEKKVKKKNRYTRKRKKKALFFESTSAPNPNGRTKKKNLKIERGRHEKSFFFIFFFEFFFFF